MLSKKGVCLHEQIVPEAIAWQAHLVSGLDSHELTHFFNILTKLSNHLNKNV